MRRRKQEIEALMKAKQKSSLEVEKLDSLIVEADKVKDRRDDNSSISTKSRKNKSSSRTRRNTLENSKQS